MCQTSSYIQDTYTIVFENRFGGRTHSHCLDTMTDEIKNVQLNNARSTVTI